VLLVNEKLSYKGDITNHNMLIQGDNVPVMKELLNGSFGFEGSIDCMIWDPPYNTGKMFIYNDRFGSHESWLTFMRERLIIAKILLKESGSIAVHIGHTGLFRLGLLMDEIFGEKNRTAIINWECSYTPKNNTKGISNTTDYVLIYAKNKKHAYRGLLPRTEEMDAQYNRVDEDDNKFVQGDIISPKFKHETIHVSDYGKKKVHFGIENPYTGKICFPPTGRLYIIPIHTVVSLMSEYGVPYEVNSEGNCVIAQGADRSQVLPHTTTKPRILFSRNGLGQPIYKRYLHELRNEGRITRTYWKSLELEDDHFMDSLPHEESGSNDSAKRLIKDVIGGTIVFDTPKPLKLTKKLIEILCPKDGIVLDAFGGSGTTAHALLDLNAEGASRRFIVIELNTFAETITAKRIHAVIEGSWAKPRPDTRAVGGSFTFLIFKNQDRVPYNYADFQEYMRSRMTKEEMDIIEKQVEEELKEENELSANNTPSN
jgi:adenine-specific DNA-methyltransferase